MYSRVKSPYLSYIKSVCQSMGSGTSVSNSMARGSSWNSRLYKFIDKGFRDWGSGYPFSSKKFPWV